jgi:hypothetical protein
MPSGRKRLCLAPACPARVTSGYCEIHPREARQPRGAVQRENLDDPQTAGGQVAASVESNGFGVCARNRLSGRRLTDPSDGHILTPLLPEILTSGVRREVGIGNNERTEHKVNAALKNVRDRQVEPC